MRFAVVPEVGALSHEAHKALCYAFCIMKAQIISFSIYYYAWRSLYKKELNQPKIVDTVAANIRFVAKGGAGAQWNNGINKLKNSS